MTTGLGPNTGTAHAKAGSRQQIRADLILLDIEGTISPISFVREVMFAYSRTRLEAYVAEHRGTAAVADVLKQASALADGADPVSALLDWHARDVKAPPLKKLQGMIWEQGFRSGAFSSPLFPDALAALRSWHSRGVPLYIYSSGSVQAQLLFFEFSSAGDLRSLFAGHFDTDIGAKTDAGAYGRIAHAVGTQPDSIAFFSDAAKELEAAKAAGLQTIHVVKDDTPPDATFSAIRDFSEVEIVAAAQS
jgi:enolase-phosphatase E1